MPAEKVVRIADFERRSKEPDAAQPRDPCEADVIVLPIVRVLRTDRLLDHGVLVCVPSNLGE